MVSLLGMEVHVDSKMLAMHRLILHESGNRLYWFLQAKKIGGSDY